MPKLKTVSILGCGWLGFPLAVHLVSKGYNVHGATTTLSKVGSLKANRITPYLLECSPDIKGDNIQSFFKSDILFVNIPFKRNLVDPWFYKKQIDPILHRAQTSGIDSIIFAGTTSIYPKTAVEALEDMVFSPDTERAKVLFEVERAVLQTGRGTVIRFAGLYGPQREIGKMAALQKVPVEGAQRVNLIHLDDCIGILDKLIEYPLKGEIVNACSDYHPTKRELYTQVMMFQKQPALVFADGQDEKPKGKVVSNKKLKKILGYSFKFPNPLDHFQ